MLAGTPHRRRHRARAQFALYIATGLPLLVAITTIQVGNGVMRPENAAAPVGAGVLSVLVFPLLGDRINGPRNQPELDAVDAARGAEARTMTPAH